MREGSGAAVDREVPAACGGEKWAFREYMLYGLDRPAVMGRRFVLVYGEERKHVL